jgi:two-component system, OmpR family, response regulator CpxR
MSTHIDAKTQYKGRRRMEKVLLIDDDLELSELVSAFLGPEGFEVHAVGSGEEGIDLLSKHQWRLIILDVMLPGMNGFNVLSAIRSTSRTPVLMLTARGSDIDRIVGLEMGADDYLPKPFNPRELIARINAILRRTESQTGGPANGPKPMIISIGDLELDSGARTVRVAGMKVKLTTVEFDLLRVLLESAGTPVTREQLIRDVLGKQYTYADRNIDIHISNLRRKLGPAGDGEDRIITVRSSGYLYAI